MSLPIEVIDELFNRLSNTYGIGWDSMWSTHDIQEVKELWASELRFFNNKWDCFHWAFENLPERPPNLIILKKLLMECPYLRSESQTYLPPPKGEPPAPEIKEKMDQLIKKLKNEV